MAQQDDSGPANDSSNVSHDPPRPGPPPPPHPPRRPTPNPSSPRPTPTLEAGPRLPRPRSEADGPQLVSPPAEGPVNAVSSYSESSSTTVASAPSEPHLNGDSQPSDSGGMSGHHLHGDSGPHHGQPMGYPAYSSAGSMPTSQYASYPSMTTTTQPAEPYRGSPVGSTPMSLPSMRTIDPMPQQGGGLPSPHHGLPMSMNVSMPAASVAGGGMAFYTHHQPSISPSYGFPDAMSRYALPHDPRLLGNRVPKKVRTARQAGCARASEGLGLLVRGLVLILPVAGDQASHQDRLFDMSQAQNQGKRPFFDSSQAWTRTPLPHHPLAMASMAF